MSIEAIDESFEVPKNESFEIRPEEHYFTKEYTVLNKNWPVAVISTNKYAYSFLQFIDWRMHFTIYDSQTGEEIAHAVKNYGFTPRGIWNLSFMGWFRPNTLADFDIYDKEGNYLGFIDGRVVDLSKAHFDFQDATGKTVAYARQEKTQLTLKEYQNSAPVGFLKRQFDVGTEDSWTLALKKEQLDQRIALIFAAFVVHNQSYFLEDN